MKWRSRTRLSQFELRRRANRGATATGRPSAQSAGSFRFSAIVTAGPAESNSPQPRIARIALMGIFHPCHPWHPWLIPPGRKDLNAMRACGYIPS